MGRPRKYATDAERQRACRQQQEARTVRVDRRALEELEQRLEQLQEAVRQAARAGDETARACQAGSVATMLEKLIGYFQASGEAGEGKASGRPAIVKGGRGSSNR
jgi:uncharacterized protein YlxW (UPF0749 family)